MRVSGHVADGFDTRGDGRASDVDDRRVFPERLREGRSSGTLTLFSVIAYFAVLLLIGRVHKAVMLLAGAVIAAIGLLPIHFDLPYSLFLAVLAAVGAGVGITDALASSSVNDLYTGPAGARVMCALHATYGLAGFVMPFLVRAMTGAGVSWRSVFMTLGFGELFASAAILAVTRGHARSWKEARRFGRYRLRT